MWRVFLGVALYVFVASINARDWPFPSIPSIYLAFPISLMLIGSHWKLLRFVKGQWLFVAVMVFQWIWYNGLRYLADHSISYRSAAYLFEPLMLFVVGAGGIIAAKDPRPALAGFLVSIVLCTLAGFWIIYIGEPISSWNEALHTYHAEAPGGMVEQLVNPDVVTWSATRNGGLSGYIPTFSYQLCGALAAASIISILQRSSNNRLFLLIATVILALGVVSNAERSAIAAAVAGIVLALWKARLFPAALPRSVVVVFVVGAVLSLYMEHTRASGAFDARMRNWQISDELVRLKAQLVAVMSVRENPIGNGGLSPGYESWASNVGLVDSQGNAIAPHNHYVNIIMYGGLVGLLCVSVLLSYIWRQLSSLLKETRSVEDSAWYAAACGGLVAALANACLHNQGPFRGELAACFLIGVVTAGGLFSRSIQKANIVEQHKSGAVGKAPHASLAEG